MIPVLIAFGLVFGRWWRTTLAVAVVSWPVALLATEVMDVSWELLGAAALALVNTAVGVLVHQALLHAVRRLGRSSRTSEVA